VGEEEVNVCKAIEDMKEEVRTETRNEGILKTVSILKNLKLSKDAATQQIVENFSLSNEEAAALVDSRW
jgi:hypothetical protein